MRRLTIYLVSFTLFFGTHSAAADTLSDAYMKEYIFLKAEKEELVTRLKEEQLQQNEEMTRGRNKVLSLQDKQVALSKELKSKETRLEKAQEELQDKTSNKDIIESLIIQAKMSLEKYGVVLDETAASPVDTMANAFSSARSLYRTLSSIRTEEGRFYLPDGTTAEGDIVRVGNVAAYGISAKANGALAPAGNGEFKIWNQPGSADDARALFSDQSSETLDMFVYENVEKDVEDQKEKTTQDVLRDGGVIGYVIVVLGAFGLLLLLLRGLFLLRAGSAEKEITQVVYSKIEGGKADEAYNAIKNLRGSTARVIRATLRNITRDREHIEDIITESILNENRALDRFGSFILVIAAVSPLLGLLGTVTGMIKTFDVITLYGTGDPKLLSGGISEALVTTMLGLGVAIPLILLGNLSNGWAESIKDSMEQSALHVVNLFEKYAAAK